MTDRYAVIGHPVAHSKSPWIHAQFARATAQDLAYERIDPGPRGFVEAVDAFRRAGGRGLNVTLPFKADAFAYCAGRVSERARLAQAVNTLRFEGEAVDGDNTDGVGLVRDLTRNLGLDLGVQRVLLLGAGGAAQGVAGALVAAGVAQLVIANRTAHKAHALAQRSGAVRGGGFDELRDERFDLVINATAAGLQGELPELPAPLFAPQALAYDMVYGRDTAFLRLARHRGLRACDGSGMLVEQAAESFFLWRGVRPDTAAVLAGLRAN